MGSAAGAAVSGIVATNAPAIAPTTFARSEFISAARPRAARVPENCFCAWWNVNGQSAALHWGARGLGLAHAGNPPAVGCVGKHNPCVAYQTRSIDAAAGWGISDQAVRFAPRG